MFSTSTGKQQYFLAKLKEMSGWEIFLGWIQVGTVGCWKKIAAAFVAGAIPARLFWLHRHSQMYKTQRHPLSLKSPFCLATP
jgi:hypothetical protein